MINISESLPGFLVEKDKIGKILQTALDAADPEKAVCQSVRRDGSYLMAGGKHYDLDSYRRIFLVGAGKASYNMGTALVNLIPDHEVRGGIIVKYMPPDASRLISRQVKVLEGEHPRPGNKSLASSGEIIKIVEEAEEKDLVFFVLSGGASSLFTSPREGIELADLQSITGLLLRSGADIGEMNTLRKHLDEVKGGGLAAMAHPADVLGLVLSDVVGSPLDVIGSGPLTGDCSSFSDAWQILEKYQLIEKTPAAVLQVLEDGIEGKISETVRPDDPILERVHQIIVGSNEKSVIAAMNAAVDLGFETQILTTSMVGEAREQGVIMANTLREKAQSTGRPVCLIAGGETTVTIRGHGMGGRNLELGLAAVERMASIKDAAFISLASDGDDGPSGAAGALVTGDTLARAKKLGINPQEYLDNNDSFTFFEKMGGLIVSGPSGTNVNDFVFMFGNLNQMAV